MAESATTTRTTEAFETTETFQTFDTAEAFETFESAETFETADNGEAALYFQRCRWCGTTMFNRLLCHICASTDFEVERSEGVGIVHRSTVLHRNTSAARNLSLIDMAEGFSVRCRVIGPPEAVRVGARVQLAEAVGADGADGADGQEIVFQLCDGAYGSAPSLPSYGLRY